MRTSDVSRAITCGSSGAERLHRAAVEDAPLDRAALEHVPLGCIELVEAGGQQRLDRRRHRDLAASRLRHERDHLLHVQRVALGRIEDPAAQVVVEVGQAPDQLLGLLRGERLEQHAGRVDLAAGPAGAAVEQLRAGHAEQQDRSVAGEIGDVLDQVEKGLLAPVHVVEDTDDGRLGGDGLELLAERPGDLVAGRDQLLVADQGADRPGGDRVVSRPVGAA